MPETRTSHVGQAPRLAPGPPAWHFFFAFLLCAAAYAQDLTTQLDTKISAALKKAGAPSVSVAVVQDGKLSYAKAFGFANLESKKPASTDTRYSVGSISKQFTAAAMLLLEEQGKLSLDDKVAKYFPDLTRASEITLRQLLSHTSGYEDYAPQDYIIPEWKIPTTTEAILNTWAKKPLNFDPVTKWQYSNTNFVLAAAIIEKVAQKSLNGMLHEYIFDPLGMKSADQMLPLRPEDATPYTRFALGPPRPTVREGRGWYDGAGQLAMTPSDLAKWDIAVIERRILNAHSYDEFTREVRLANGDATHYALGLQIGELNGQIPRWSHSGEVSGFITYNAVYPTRKGAVIVLSNQDVINMVGPIGATIASTVFLPAPPKEADTKQVTSILTALQQGKIDRSLLTANANTYFTDIALKDCKDSLAPLGKLKQVVSTSEESRGGMTHRSYRAEFEKKNVSLNIYLLPDGQYEQFLVEDQL
jgi:CubicO group peptidase (beta-lactamase class C family)